MASADYHRRQAEVLNKLASSTRDPETSASLRLLAAEHVALADEAASTTDQVPIVMAARQVYCAAFARSVLAFSASASKPRAPRTPPIGWNKRGHYTNTSSSSASWPSSPSSSCKLP